VIGGLVAATIATLFFVPTVFSFVHRCGRVAKSPTELEPFHA
jgi:Cu/Ag efflux pump CusA